ncbi:tim-barrel domain-containing protein [Linnemannia elongata]|nr:tim-barrel domain-containing protein [Linnemannia elongata]
MAKGTSRSWSSSLALVAVAAVAFLHTTATAAPTAQTQSLYGLVERLLPKAYHTTFDFQIVSESSIPPSSPKNKYDVYRVSNVAATAADANATGHGRPTVLIEGTTLSALGVGLKYYLEQAAQVELTWSGNRFNELPAQPPRVPDLELDSGNTVTTGHVHGSFVPWRYYTNVVTFGYQFAFWDWSRWERELDWMVLNGVNQLPAMVGQEYVLREFFRSLGVKDADFASFFSGPTYQPWQRMGNMQGSWTYKLTGAGTEADELAYKNRWIDSQWALQQKILARLDGFNITSVLPAFQGFVPRALKNLYPQADIRNSSTWSGFPIQYTNVTYVEPTDPLFAKLSVDYLKLQDKLNNGHRSHLYLLDLYNELIPSCLTEVCLKAISKAVSTTLQTADKDAVWVMQGWFLTAEAWNPARGKAYLEGIQEAGGKSFVYDLASDSIPVWDSFDGFFGSDFGWSVINNYGASQGLFGKLSEITVLPYTAFAKYPNHLRGIGVTAEGINNNEFIYDLTYTFPWVNPDQPALNIPKRLEQFIQRRYGPSRATPKVQEAWKLLSETVWDSRTKKPTGSKSYIEKPPAVNMADGGWLGTIFWYNKTTVVHAWDTLVQSGVAERNAAHGRPLPKSYIFDLVDTTREILLATVFPSVHGSLIAAYNRQDVAQIRTAGRQLLEVANDADRLLSSQPLFSFGAWVKEARDSSNLPLPTGSTTPSTFNRSGFQQFLESNARNLITWWGPESAGLADYGSKQWGGLISSYYVPRWQLFIAQLELAAQQKRDFDPAAFSALVSKHETAWQAQRWGDRNGESWASNGYDSIDVVRQLWVKYAALAAKIAASED